MSQDETRVAKTAVFNGEKSIFLENDTSRDTGGKNSSF